MVQRLYADEELDQLRSVRKQVSNANSRWSEKPTVAPVHRQRSFKAIGEGGGESRFEIYQREGLLDQSDFSCGIVYVALDGSRLTLGRYNGPGHEHGDIHYRTHIHRATGRAIAAGMKPEREAEATDRYRTLEGALACLIDDFNVVGINAVHDQPRLL